MTASEDISLALWEIEQIKQLKARYFRAIDTEDWELLAGCMTRDAHVVPPPPALPIEGGDTMVNQLSEYRTERAEVVTVHYGHMPEIELTGKDTARGIWAMQAYSDRVWNHDGSRDAFHAYGHYHEEYRKTDGRWQISELRLTFLRVDTPPVEHLVPFPHRAEPQPDVMPYLVKSS